MSLPKRVLAIGAHPDDAELGCGATLAAHAMAGDEVTISALGQGRSEEQWLKRHDASRVLGCGTSTWAHLATVDQRFDAIDRQEFVRAVEALVISTQPDIIYTHHAGDRNLDHRIVADAVLTACRPLPGSSIKRILTFEVPSSTEWGDGFAPNVFVDVSGEPWMRKAAALDCYESEMRAFPHPRSPRALDALSLWRGASAGVERAEAFMLVRGIE